MCALTGSTQPRQRSSSDAQPCVGVCDWFARYFLRKRSGSCGGSMFVARDPGGRTAAPRWAGNQGPRRNGRPLEVRFLTDSPVKQPNIEHSKTSIGLFHSWGGCRKTPTRQELGNSAACAAPSAPRGGSANDLTPAKPRIERTNGFATASHPRFFGTAASDILAAWRLR